MRRTNTFAVRPLTDEAELLMRTLLDTSVCLWNQLNDERLQNVNKGESVWETARLPAGICFVGVTGSLLSLGAIGVVARPLVVAVLIELLALAAEHQPPIT